MNFKQIFKVWKGTALILSIILLIGFGIRIINLTILPIFVDEAIYVRWAQVMAAEPTLRFLPLSDGKQPLYMWVLMFLIKYFQDPLFIGRLISVTTGIGTIIGIFVFSYLLFNKKILSLLSSFLYAISPFSVFFDRMALVDSMLSMFGIWTAIFGYLTAKSLPAQAGKRLDLALITGFLLGFASLTKSPAIFMALLLPTFWFLNKWSGIWKLGVTYLLAFAMYNIQRLGPNFALLSSRTGDYVLPISHVWTNTFDPLIPHLKDFVVWLVSMGPIATIPLVLIGIYVGFSKKLFKETLILLIWVIVPVFAQAELGKTFTARYVFFTLPYLFILMSLAFMSKTNWLKTIDYGLTVLFLAQALKFDYNLLTNPEKANLPRGERSGYLEEWTAGQGIKEVSVYLRDEEAKNPGKQIVVGTEGFFGTLPDGLQLYLNDLPNIIVKGVGVVIEDVPESLKEAVKAGNKTYLVVNKSRFKGDIEKQGYKLIAKYPKGLRLTDSKQFYLYGPREELLFFELLK